MKVTKGKNKQQIAVICESYGVKSPISRKIVLQNDVKEVRMTNDFSLDTNIEFLENEDGDIVLTPVELDDIQVYVTDHNDNPITDIDPDELFVAIITED